MPRDFFDPTPEEQQVVLIDAETRRKAEKLIESCEQCNPLAAEISFDNILDRVTGSDPTVTDYILEAPAKCPHCRRETFSKRLSLSRHKRNNQMVRAFLFDQFAAAAID